MASKVVVTKTGRQLTEADIERVADEAERGFDLSTWRHSRGRPALEPGDTDSPRIAVRLPASLHRRVQHRALAEGRSVSQVVRDLLQRYADEPQAATRT